MPGEAGAADQAQRARELAYGYIDRREHTVAEVAAKLARVGVDPACARDAIDELVAVGLLDDVRFAKLFAQDKRELEQWGAERIERGLLARGIDRELAEVTLAEHDPDGELRRALALLARRFPRPPVDRRDRARALGVLLRKGFDSDLAVQAVRESAEDRRESAEDRRESAEDRHESAEDRRESAEDRHESAEDRHESAEDRHESAGNGDDRSPARRTQPVARKLAGS